MKPPLSLYVHIPWCVRKCPYCDFNSHASPQTLPEREYLQALVEDLNADLDYVRGREIQSIFFGGGTPSLFSGAAIGAILDAIQQKLTLAPDCEITLEANPGTVEQQRFIDYAKAGINRLSIGVQSFQATQLRALGRIHSSDEALRAVASAHTAGIDNINIDLMHGLPEQGIGDAEADLQQAIALGVPHISWYQLTIEQNTEFFKRPPVLPDEDRLADIQSAGLAVLADAGFAQYEVSAYSRQRPARHNLNYWQFGDYLGIGAGAHGKVTTPQGVLRYQKTRLPEHYMRGSASRSSKQSLVAPEDLPFEFMMNALRLNQGFDAPLFEQRTGLPLATIEEKLHGLEQQGLLEREADEIRCSELGRQFLNTVLDQFLPA